MTPAEITSTAIVVAFATFLAAFAAFYLLRKASIIDVPVQTSSHTRPTVSGGGVSVILVLAVAAWLFEEFDLWIVVAFAAVALVSLIDDANDLPIWPRLCIQIGAALLLSSQIFPNSLLAIFIGTFWMVAICNASNFFDGLNGLFTSQVIISAGFSAAFCGISGPGSPGFWFLMIAASCFGFLFHNFPRARLFAGDVGSVTLGLLMGFLTLWAFQEYGFKTALAIAIVQANLILDTGVTVIRRILTHREWRFPHRGFFFHRLMLSGFSHTRVTLVESAIQLLLGMLVFIALKQSGNWLLLAGCLSLIVWVAFLLFCEKRFRNQSG